MTTLNYTTLQSTILDKAKRSDKAAQCPGYIRECESMIRRKVLALESRATLDETDRVSEGLYNLPSNVQEVRAIFGAVNGNPIELRNVGMRGLLTFAETDSTQVYGVIGATVEFRGIPGTGSEFTLVSFGWPEPLDTVSTNELLNLYEDLYIHGSLFFLYNDTQDRELAQDALSIFEDVVKHLNKVAQRRQGNPAAPPAYNFGSISTGPGY